MENKRIRISFIGFIFASIFIFNPNINIIDLLPDFIGYIIITVSISKIADLNETLDEARIAFQRMIWIDAAKVLALFWSFGMAYDSEQNSSLLLWSFVFGVVELIFAVPAFSKLFSGLMSLADRYPSGVIFYRKKHLISQKLRRKSEAERLRTYTLVFLTLKAVFSFLPELADLSNTAYDEQSGFVDLYQFVGLLRFLAFIPILILGLIWIVRMIVFFARIMSDAPFISALENDYIANVLPREGHFIKRRIQASFLVLIIAVVLTVDFRLENINVLPDILSAIAFIALFSMLGKYISKAKKFCFASSITFIVASTLSYVSECYFFSNYSYNDIIRSDEAYAAFIIMIGLEIVKGAVLVLTIIGTYRALSLIINDHTGYVLGQENITEATERQANALRAELRAPLKFMVVLAAVYVVSDIAYDALIDTANFMGVINIICAFAFIACVIKAQSEILLAVKTKYMLE